MRCWAGKRPFNARRHFGAFVFMPTEKLSPLPCAYYDLCMVHEERCAANVKGKILVKTCVLLLVYYFVTNMLDTNLFDNI